MALNWAFDNFGCVLTLLEAPKGGARNIQEGYIKEIPNQIAPGGHKSNFEQKQTTRTLIFFKFGTKMNVY